MTATLNARNIDQERVGLPELIGGTDLIGIELGVATGDFSAKLWKSGRFKQLWGVDAYGDHHDTKEYVAALKLVGLESNYRLLRMYFEEAHALFPDEYFDFVYIDGYAHTGEEAGKTLYDWYAKVKVGGMIAGHDYHVDWPFVMMAVDRFSSDGGLELMVSQTSSDPGPQDMFPSWAAIKTNNKPVAYPTDLNAEIEAAAKQKKKNRSKKIAADAGIKASRYPWRYLRRHKLAVPTAAVPSTHVSELAGRGEGKDLLILGSAPSVADLDLSSVAHCDVMFLNRAGELADHLAVEEKMLIVSDQKAVDEISGAFSFKNFTTLLCSADLKLDTAKVPHHFNYFASPNIYHGFAQHDLTKPLYHCHTVAGFAVQLAVGMRYQNVYLAGIDLDFDEDTTHFYHSSKRERLHSRILSAPKGPRMRAGLAYLAYWAGKHGVAVWNTSPKNSLPLVGKRAFDDVFQPSKR